MLKKILLIGSLTKHEAHGVSLGFESLIDGFKLTNCDVRVMDTKGFHDSKKIGSFAFGRAMISLKCIFIAWGAIPSRQSIYMTISLSRLGFIRDMLVIWAAWLMRKRIVLHLKGGGYKVFYSQQSKWLQYVIAVTLSLSTHIVVLGDLLREQFDFVSGINDKLKVVPNGLTKDLQVTTNTKELPKNDQPIKILYLSNLIPSKGYLTLLSACIKLVEESDIEFVCNYCGAFTQTIVDGNNMDPKGRKTEFQGLIKSNNLTEQVFYHGTVTGKVKEQMLSQAHIFVLPTRFPWEGQPLSIIEALAFSTPTISTPYRGIPEEVFDGQNGYLIPPDDPKALVQAIRKLAENPTRYKRMSKEAQNLFKKKFTRKIHLKKLTKIICDI